MFLKRKCCKTCGEKLPLFYKGDCCKLCNYMFERFPMIAKYKINTTYGVSSSDRCVCCGEEIPEGYQVCKRCFDNAGKENEGRD